MSSACANYPPIDGQPIAPVTRAWTEAYEAYRRELLSRDPEYYAREYLGVFPVNRLDEQNPLVPG